MPRLTPMPMYNHACTACLLHEHARTVCVPANGTNKMPALVVGEAPGANEDRTGVPFVGRAGEVLNRALKEAFVTEQAREELVVTNVVKCRPPSNRKPTSEEISTCLDLYLIQEIELYNPIAILALGNTACEALTGYTGVSSLRGEWKQLDSKKERWVLPTWHPAYVLYQGGVGSETWKQFLEDVCTFAGKVIALY